MLGEQSRRRHLPIIAGQQPTEIATRAMQAARLQAVDVLLLDTAGRLHVDQAADGRDEGGLGHLHRRAKRCWWSMR